MDKEVFLTVAEKDRHFKMSAYFVFPNGATPTKVRWDRVVEGNSGEQTQ